MKENSRPSQSHIDSIVKQEEEALERRSSSERFATVSDSLPRRSLCCVSACALGCVAPGEQRHNSWITPLRPLPFLSTRNDCRHGSGHSFQFHPDASESDDASRRASDHLNLQVDLLAEKEITKVLQMVRAICGHMGLQDIMGDKEIRELSQTTSIESLSQTLEDRLPGT